MSNMIGDNDFILRLDLKDREQRYRAIKNELERIFLDNKISSVVPDTLIDYLDHIFVFGYLSDNVFEYFDSHPPANGFDKIKNESLDLYNFLSSISNDQISSVSIKSKNGEKVTFAYNVFIDLMLNRFREEFIDLTRPFIKNTLNGENTKRALSGRKTKKRNQLIKTHIDRIVEIFSDKYIKIEPLVKYRYLVINIISILGLSKYLPGGTYSNHNYDIDREIGKSGIFKGTYLEKNETLPTNSPKKS